MESVREHRSKRVAVNVSLRSVIDRTTHTAFVTHTIGRKSGALSYGPFVLRDQHRMLDSYGAGSVNSSEMRTSLDGINRETSLLGPVSRVVPQRLCSGVLPIEIGLMSPSVYENTVLRLESMKLLSTRNRVIALCAGVPTVNLISTTVTRADGFVPCSVPPVTVPSGSSVMILSSLNERWSFCASTPSCSGPEPREG